MLMFYVSVDAYLMLRISESGIIILRQLELKKFDTEDMYVVQIAVWQKFKVW